MKQLTIYASSEGTKNFVEIGNYDGLSYVGENPYNYNFIRIHESDDKNNFLHHIPKRFYGDLLSKFEKLYIDRFGNQLSLDDLL
ncbi:hypothetical protein [Jeotgalicoccus sp. S0W5]|uniref:hypothetical protein n=1 Tax=Jeotgalicoccus sp. S0W5 TaxID=2527874 RepID=UPI001414E78F|nr:hypothetical protein [Jeotgalicoccus sp. S0W5]